MAIQPIGYVCYNNADLERHGYIYQYIDKEHLMSSSTEINTWENKLNKNPPKGIVYIPERNSQGTLTKVGKEKDNYRQVR